MPIRLATRSDAQKIHDLHTKSVTNLCTLYSEEIISGWLAKRSPEGYKGIEKKEMFVFEDHGEILGFSHVIPGEIVALFVSPNYSRRGIGTALMQHALQCARYNWKGTIKIESTLNAVPFYEAMGFRKTGESVLRRNHVEIPSILMEEK